MTMDRRNDFDSQDADDLPTPISPQHFLLMQEEEAAAGADIVRNIASFLTVSDAQSLTSGYGLDTPSVSENWASHAGGTPFQWGSMMQTPPTPALVAISPNPLDDEFSGNYLQYQNRDDPNTSLVLEEDSIEDYAAVKRRRNAWAQERIANAVFSHPAPLRNYCIEAYESAKEVRLSQNLATGERSPETHIEPSNEHLSQQGPKRNHFTFLLKAMLHHLFHNVPLSVAVHVLCGFREVSLDTSFATVRITSMTIHGIVDALIRLIGNMWYGVTHFNPLAAAQAIISRPFNAMGKTTEVVVSGIQSVATGVGSASSLAFHRLSSKTASSSNLAPQNALFRNRLGSPKASQKLIRKLSTIHSAASVIRYEEIADDTGGLSKRMKSRVQRMLHYDVSLRPFVATVKLPPELRSPSTDGMTSSSKESTSNERQDANESETTQKSLVRSEAGVEGDDVSATSSPESLFMCTPQSFPPTPTSRCMVLARGTRFADDVIFLARDHLRLHGALGSENERTREMAMALTRGRQLAVFDADDTSAGIELSCGQHVATKVDSMLYCSTRSMVPILRNCFVYFEMTVLPRPSGNLIQQASMATLSIGLSTKEMPSNTLVGAWKGSVGICATGQMLTAGQWCSPVDPNTSAYGDGATVGCLVCLDDGSAYETWEGMSVTAGVTFAVNQQIVSPPVSTLPMAAATVDTLVTNLPTPMGSPMSMDLGGPPRTPPLRIGPAPTSFTLPLLVPAEEELFPTVTLHSPGTAVMCRFSLGDVLATTRAAIGAPPGVAVYAIDGSLILSDKD